MPKVIYKDNKAFVDVSSTDRKVARKVGVKFPRKKRITVDKYADVLGMISKARTKKERMRKK